MPTRAHLEALAYRLGWVAGPKLPEAVARAVLQVFADGAWRRRGPRVETLESNLAHAVPDLDGPGLRQLSRAAMRSYLRYWGEVFRLPRWSTDDLRARVVTHDVERLLEPLAAGRGVVAALPHMGNWDLAGAWACAEGLQVSAVVERLQPDALFEDFVRYRESLGMAVVPLTSGPPVTDLLVERLHNGGLVCLLADRRLSGRGLRVPFLDATARLPPGPAWLARRTGTSLLPVSTSYEGDLMHLWCHPPIQVGEGASGLIDATAQMAACFSTAIRRDPVDWHMLQAVFDETPRRA